MNSSLVTCFFLCGIVMIKITASEVDYYELLGLTKEASDLEIRQAFKKLAIVYHPDKNPDAPREHFIKISEAYETLKNPVKRQEYNYMKQGRTRQFRAYGMSTAEYNDLFQNGLYSKDANVESLSGANFYEFVDSGFAFVNFYSPFCPPCQNLADTWKGLASKFKGIVKIGAVNCKLYSGFCSHTMGIMSYPTLLFYRKDRNRFSIYRGQHSLASLEIFLTNFIDEEYKIPTVSKLVKDGNPVLYIMGDRLLEHYTVLKLAFKLKHSVKVCRVMDEKLRQQLTKYDESATAVFDSDDKRIIMNEYNDDDIIEVMINAFPEVKEITPEDIFKMRSELRSEKIVNPWFLHFYAQPFETNMLIKRLAMSHGDVHFGIIDCDKWFSLCLSFQMDSPPGWGMLKKGGSYEAANLKTDFHEISEFIRISKDKENYQTLSSSEFAKVTDGQDSFWILALVPQNVYWKHIEVPFKITSSRFNKQQIQFGVVNCKKNYPKCKDFTENDPLLMVQNATKSFIYRDEYKESKIVEFIDNIFNNKVVYLNEKAYNEKLNPKAKEDVWFIFFSATHCGAPCDKFEAELRIVSNKLRPFDFIHIAIIDCKENRDFCIRLNIVKPTIRLYARNNNYGYVGTIEELKESPYIISWILDRFDTTITPLTEKSYRELISNPSRLKPWLVYFHSPRCSFCYEYYPDFVLSGLKLGNKVKLGRVNCIAERQLCYENKLQRYPSILLYANRNNPSQFLHIESLKSNELLQEVQKRLAMYNVNVHTEL